MTGLARFTTSAADYLNDADRLAALDSYAILDTPPEQGFDGIVQLATLSCDAPVALVSLVAGDRQWFKARAGFPHCQTDLNRAICTHALAAPDLLVIPDLRQDPRTANNPLVTGPPAMRFYAGAPLRSPQGHVLGTVCVLDVKPRPDGLTERQADMLRTLARQVVALLEFRRAVDGRDSFIARRRNLEQRLGESADRLKISEALWRGLFEGLSDGLVIAKVVRDAAHRPVDWCYLDVNRAWAELIGVDPAAVIGRSARDVFPDIGTKWNDELALVADTGEPLTFTRYLDAKHRWFEGRAFPLDDDRCAILFIEITGRIHADRRRDALLELGDQLRDLTAIGDMTSVAAAIVGRALGVTRAGFGRLDAECEHLVIEPDWTVDGMPSIAGRHRFADYGDIRRDLLLGQPLIIEDAATDPRTAGDAARWLAVQVAALVNVPIRERGRTVAVFIVQDDKPRTWPPETIAFLRGVADRLSAAVSRKQAEQQQEVLNQELSHRMKNMLAMVQAIASQTLKGVTEQDIVAGFVQRLHALSSAHDMLLLRHWASAPMREVVEAALQAFGSTERLSVDGPDVILGPRATLSLSLLLHELATNAAKFGALSVEAGRVSLAWRLDAAMDELVFSWTERDGPRVSEPTRRGLGSRLIRSGLLGTGGVTVRYDPAGLAVEMRAAIDQVRSA